MLSSPKLTDDECLPFTIKLLYFSKYFSGIPMIKPMTNFCWLSLFLLRQKTLLVLVFHVWPACSDHCWEVQIMAIPELPVGRYSFKTTQIRFSNPCSSFLKKLPIAIVWNQNFAHSDTPTSAGGKPEYSCT